MASESNHNIRIFGAGIAGLSLAIHLRKLGVGEDRISVTEKRTVEDLRTSSDSYVSVKKEHLDWVVESAGEHSATAAAIEEAPRLTTLTLQYPNDPQTIPLVSHSVFLKRSELALTLNQDAETAGVRVTWGTEADEVSVAELMRQHPQDRIVGADGIHSRVRRVIQPDYRAEYLHQEALFAHIPRIDGFQEENLAFYRDGDGLLTVGVYTPKGDGDQIVFARFPVEQFNLITDLGLGVPDPVLAALEQSDVQFHVYSSGTVNWGKDKLTLLGDAAHGDSPQDGMGASNALKDARHIASVLA